MYWSSLIVSLCNLDMVLVCVLCVVFSLDVQFSIPAISGQIAVVIGKIPDDAPIYGIHNL